VSARQYLAESIRSPSAFVSPAFSPGRGPAASMPRLGLDDGDIEAVVDYLLQG
jgi:hypothetical protein